MMVDELELKRIINVREAMRILAIKTGKYAAFCRAYSRRKVADGVYELVYPNLKNDFDSDMMPLLDAVCQGTLGDNPNHPMHPVRLWKGDVNGQGRKEIGRVQR